jgi:type I restriction enzyme M protein
VVSYDEIEAKNYSFSAGQFFDVKVEHIQITAEEYDEKVQGSKTRLKALFSESHGLEADIVENLRKLCFAQS